MPQLGDGPKCQSAQQFGPLPLTSEENKGTWVLGFGFEGQEKVLIGHTVLGKVDA